MHGLMMETPLTITGIMRFAERNFADREVVSVTHDAPRHRTNWREIFRRARKLANALRAAGVKPGDRIGTLAWNDYRHLELYYAVSCMGAVLHTVNPRLFPEQVEFIVNHAEDKLLFVDATLLPALAPLEGKLPCVERVVVLASAASLPAAAAGKFVDYESFIEPHPEQFEWPELDERTASGLCYTSGTTGHPKGVLYSHRSTVIHAYAGCMTDSMNLSARDCVLTVVPMFHANAWGLPYNAPMTGAKLVFPGPKMGDAAVLTQLMNEERVTLAAGVPTVWQVLLNYLAQTGTKLETLERTLIGGSAVPLQMIRDFRDRHGVTVVQGWGMTELSPLGTVSTLKPDQQALPDEEQVLLRGKAGHGVFGIAMKVVDESGQELPWDGSQRRRTEGARPICLPRLLPARPLAGARRGRVVRDRRRRDHPPGRLPADHRPRQGRDQVRRRMDQLRRPRELRMRSCGRADGRGDRRASPEVGRASGAAGRAEARLHAAVRVDHGAPGQSLREVAVAGYNPVRRDAADDRDRQDQQAVAARRLRTGADEHRGLSAARFPDRHNPG